MKIININIENVHFESQEKEVWYSNTPIHFPTGMVEVQYNIETSIGSIKNKVSIFDSEYEGLNLQQLKDYILRELGVTKESEQTVKEASTVAFFDSLKPHEYAIGPSNEAVIDKPLKLYIEDELEKQKQ